MGKHHYRQNGTLVIRVNKSELLESPGRIVDVLNAGEVLGGGIILRGVYYKPLEIIMQHGKDRTEERDFNFWLSEELILQRRNECTECNTKNKYEDIVKSKQESFLDQIYWTKELSISCPFQDPEIVSDVPNDDCPIYMSVAGGPDVIWGYYYPDELQRELLQQRIKDILENDLAGNVYEHLLFYDSAGLEPFDRSKYVFKSGVDPRDVLKGVVSRI
jgi:hypothetical protein